MTNDEIAMAIVSIVLFRALSWLSHTIARTVETYGNPLWKVVLWLDMGVGALCGLYLLWFGLRTMMRFIGWEA